MIIIEKKKKKFSLRARLESTILHALSLQRCSRQPSRTYHPQNGVKIVNNTNISFLVRFFCVCFAN